MNSPAISSSNRRTFNRLVPFLIAIVIPFILQSISASSRYNWKLIVGIAVMVALATWVFKSTPTKDLSHRDELRLTKTPFERSVSLVAVFVAISIPFILSADIDPPFDFPWSTWMRLVNFIFAFALGAAAFNLLVGFTGQISLGHVAFLILGTIVGAQIGVVWELPFWVTLPASLVAGAVIGIIVGLPALRLRGLYLLLATLGVHFLSLMLWKDYILAKFGFVGARFPDPTIPSWLHWLPFIEPDEDGVFLIDSMFRWYWVILIICTATLLFMTNITRTRDGRAFEAVRERDISASLLGINVARSKLIAFAVSSAVVTMSGTILSYLVSARGEESFSLQIVIDYSIIIVVGGFASIQGAFFGSVFYWVFPELFQWGRQEIPGIKSIGFLSDYPEEIDLGVNGLLVLLILLFKPSGLSGIWQDIKAVIERKILSRSSS